MRKTTAALLASVAFAVLGCGSAADITADDTGAAPAPAATTAAPQSVKVGQALTVDTGAVQATWTVTKVEVKDA
ncbi:hypothetical protein, partial [Catenuloplanes indicus]